MINNYPIVNIYEKESLKSKLSSQLIYGERFQVLNKKKGWLKIKTSYDTVSYTHLTLPTTPYV